MPKEKGKGKGKGKGKKDGKEKMPQVDRTFYELTITDLNQKLARLRAYTAKIDGENEELTEKMRSMNEDRTDVTAYLDRTLVERNETIRELDDRLTEVSKLRETENAEFTAKIKDWEAKYKAMVEQLTSEIKLLNGKLNSLEEFRVQRDLLLAKFDDQEQLMRENQKKHMETINDMEQKAIIEKDILKREVENKLLQLSEDFTKSSEIRNAGYIRRLIRENISLSKEIDSLILTQMRMIKEHKDAVDRINQMGEEYKATENMKQRLILNCQHKIEIIERLTTSYEILKHKYFQMHKFRKLYEEAAKRDICERFTYNELLNKIRVLRQRVDDLKNDRIKLISLHQQHDIIISHLRQIISGIQTSVQNAIEEKQPIEGETRKNLLCELMTILAQYSDSTEDVQSVATMSSEISTYRPGTMGFLPRPEESLLERLKADEEKYGQIGVDKPKLMEGKIIPKPHSVDDEAIVDVEYGTTLYMSTTADEVVEAPEDDEGAEDGGGFGSSSASESTPRPAPSPQKASETSILKEPSPKPSEAVEVPPQVESATVYDGEEEAEEEDYNIELFY